MNELNCEQLEQKLARAIEKNTPDRADALADRPVERASGSEWYLRGKKKTGKVLPLVAACAALVLCGSLFLNYHPDASLYMDVNPSITMDINCFDKVVSARANNPDGEKVLEEMDLRHTDVNVAANAVLGSMVKNGFIAEGKGTILLSVDGKTEKRAEALRAEVSQQVESGMKDLVSSSSVLSQSVHTDNSLQEKADQYGITPGKVLLMEKIQAANPEIQMDEVAQMPMGELMKVLKQENIDVRDFGDYIGTVLLEDIEPDDDEEEILEELLEGPDDDTDDQEDDPDDNLDDPDDPEDNPDDDLDDPDDPEDDPDDDPDDDLDDLDDPEDDPDDDED